MALINGKFVNIGCCGYSESAEGIGDASISGYRNFGNDPWPQMDIGSINFYNPKVATDEVASNRRLTRNQAIWLTNQITNFANSLTFPNEEEFDRTQNGQLLPVEQVGTEEESPYQTLRGYLKMSADIAEGEDKKGWAGAMREAAEGMAALHSLEASMTEVARDHPSWMRPCDNQALVRARKVLKSTT